MEGFARVGAFPGPFQQRAYADDPTGLRSEVSMAVSHGDFAAGRFGKTACSRSAPRRFLGMTAIHYEPYIPFRGKSRTSCMVATLLRLSLVVLLLSIASYSSSFSLVFCRLWSARGKSPALISSCQKIVPLVVSAHPFMHVSVLRCYFCRLNPLRSGTSQPRSFSASWEWCASWRDYGRASPSTWS